MRKPYATGILSAVLAVASDLHLKELMSGFLTAASGKVDLIGSWLSLRLEQNTGMAFGIDLPQAVLVPVIAVLIFAALYLAKTHLNLDKPAAQILTGMIIGGALSNLIERILHGHVTDFISIWKWPVFNLADAFITVGIFSVIVFYGKLKKINKQQK